MSTVKRNGMIFKIVSVPNGAISRSRSIALGQGGCISTCGVSLSSLTGALDPSPDSRL